jgi:DNA-binding NarL/FixJ family response regulator
MCDGVAGARDEPFPGRLPHVLRDLGLGLETGRSREGPPDLVLVAVEHGQVNRRLAAARERARGAPVIALLRDSDVELAGLALAAGAHAFHALDTSLDHLRAAVLILLNLNSARDHRVASRSLEHGRAARSLPRAASASLVPV